MILFALSPEWNDFYAVGGFFVGVVGFAVTIWQLTKTKKAVVASREAAAKTLEESKYSFERFIGDYASRLVSELQNAVNLKDWKHAKTRAEDIAELLAMLWDPSSRTIVEEARGFVLVFAQKANQPNASFDREKFRELLSRIHTRLDSLRAPFREESHEQRSTNNPGPNASPDRSNALDEDARRRGDLGSTGDSGAASTQQHPDAR